MARVQIKELISASATSYSFMVFYVSLNVLPLLTKQG
jgi:hypothetical protein